MALQSIWRLSEAINLAYKVESNLSKNSSKSSSNCRGQYDTAQDKLQLISNQLAPSQPSTGPFMPEIAPSSSKTAQKAPIQPTKANPYAHPLSGRCDCCNQNGHKSNEYPQRKPVNMVDGDVKEGKEPKYVLREDFDGAKLVERDEGDPIVCIIQWLLFTRQQEVSQRHSIFSYLLHNTEEGLQRDYR